MHLFVSPAQIHIRERARAVVDAAGIGARAPGVARLGVKPTLPRSIWFKFGGLRLGNLEARSPDVPKAQTRRPSSRRSPTRSGTTKRNAGRSVRSWKGNALAALLGIGRGPPTEIDARLVPLTQGGDLPLSASREDANAAKPRRPFFIGTCNTDTCRSPRDRTPLKKSRRDRRPSADVCPASPCPRLRWAPSV
jgi:hypothetical protein